MTADKIIEMLEDESYSMAELKQAVKALEAECKALRADAKRCKEALQSLIELTTEDTSKLAHQVFYKCNAAIAAEGEKG